MAELRLGENIVVPAIVIKEGAEINNQDKTITQNGQYTADEGYTGLGTVTVNVSGGGGGTSIPDYSFENFIGTIDSDGSLRWRTEPFDISFPGIRKINENPGNGFMYSFVLKNINNMSFQDLEEIMDNNSPFWDMLIHATVGSISFPSLRRVVQWGLGGLLSGVQGKTTLHFRADSESTIKSLPEYTDWFGAEEEPIVLFDL